MTNRLLILWSTLVCLSCGERLVEPPEDLIPKETMIDILYDISIIDAIDNTYPTALKDNGLEVMAFVYEKYGVDSTQYVESDLYYASDPSQYKEIYQTLHNRLQKQRDSLTNAIQQSNEEPDTQEKD